MEDNKIKKIYEILNNIPVTEDNADLIEEIREELLNQDYMAALSKIKELNEIQSKQREDTSKSRKVGVTRTGIGTTQNCCISMVLCRVPIVIP